MKNLLNKNGIAFYFGKILTGPEDDRYFTKLLHAIAWQHDELILFGKRIITKREVAWYGDKGLNYTYSNITKTTLPWTPELLALKHLVENTTRASYNSCLLNLYHDGSEGMAWHADNEKELLNKGSIASLSLGAERRFVLKHKISKETVSVMLEQGSLLEMKGEIQDYWLHRLPPVSKVAAARINLTFRTIVPRP